MDEPIQHLCRTFQHLMLLICQHDFLWGLIVTDHVQGIVIVRYLTAETTKVEVILYIVFIHLAKELVASQATEPANPACFLLLALTHLLTVLAV